MVPTDQGRYIYKIALTKKAVNVKILETGSGFYNLESIGAICVSLEEEDHGKWWARLYLGATCINLLNFENELDALKFQVLVLAEIRHFLWADGSWRVLKELVSECMERSLNPVFGASS